jgi:hypothetical protein
LIFCTHSSFIYLWSYLFNVLWLMCFQVYCMISHRLKGKKGVFRRRQGFHSTPSCYLHFTVTPHRSPIWYNLHSYIVCQRRRANIRAYISLTSIGFWRFMPKGEKVLPQSKRTAPPPISKIMFFQFVLKKFFEWVSYFWYNFKLVWPLSKLISKTLLNTKRRIYLRGSFV